MYSKYKNTYTYKHMRIYIYTRIFRRVHTLFHAQTHIYTNAYTYTMHILTYTMYNLSTSVRLSSHAFSFYKLKMCL